MEIREEAPSYLEEYARVSIAFEVTSILEVSLCDNGLAGFAFVERPLNPTFVKDYDAIPGNRPTDWARQFDLSNWGLLSARLGDEYVGGAVIAARTPGLLMLEDRSDLAVVWDLRVAPQARGRGVGSALLRSAQQWAAAQRCRQIKIETQNNNVPACRFYASQGCTLGAIHRFAYRELPEEVQLLWYRDLGDDSLPGA